MLAGISGASEQQSISIFTKVEKISKTKPKCRYLLQGTPQDRGQRRSSINEGVRHI